MKISPNFADYSRYERRKFKYEFSDNDIYEGYWLDAKFDGFGKHQFADGVYSPFLYFNSHMQ